MCAIGVFSTPIGMIDASSEPTWKGTHWGETGHRRLGIFVWAGTWEHGVGVLAWGLALQHWWGARVPQHLEKGEATPNNAHYRRGGGTLVYETPNLR